MGMPSHYVHDEEEVSPSPEWDWIGPDGLTDPQRALQEKKDDETDILLS